MLARGGRKGKSALELVRLSRVRAGAKPKDQMYDPYMGSLCPLPPHIVPKTRTAKYGVSGEECPKGKEGRLNEIEELTKISDERLEDVNVEASETTKKLRELALEDEEFCIDIVGDKALLRPAGRDDKNKMKMDQKSGNPQLNLVAQLGEGELG